MIERCLLIVTGYPTARGQHVTEEYDGVRVHAGSIVPIFAYGYMIQKSSYVIRPATSSVCWSVTDLRVRDQEDMSGLDRLERPIRVGF